MLKCGSCYARVGTRVVAVALCEDCAPPCIDGRSDPCPPSSTSIPLSFPLLLLKDYLSLSSSPLPSSWIGGKSLLLSLMRLPSYPWYPCTCTCACVACGSWGECICNVYTDYIDYIDAPEEAADEMTVPPTPELPLEAIMPLPLPVPLSADVGVESAAPMERTDIDPFAFDP